MRVGSCPHPFTPASVSSSMGYQTDRACSEKCKQKVRRDESSGWEMGHSSLVGRGLNNFVPEIKMLIRVALRNPHLLTSQALRQPHMPQAATPWQRRQEVRAPLKGSQLRPRKYAAWKPGSDRPWIALSGPQRGGPALPCPQRPHQYMMSFPSGSPGKHLPCSLLPPT